MTESGRRSAWAGALLAVVSTVGLVLNSAPAEAVFPGANGKIVAVRGRNLVTMTADGHGVQEIGPSTGVASAPVWSPDGSTIAFLRARHQHVSIQTIDAGGGNRRRVVDSADLPQRFSHWGISFGSLAWSPDGTRLAFSAVNRRFASSVITVAADGTDLFIVTTKGHSDSEPAWSNDGTRIVATSGTWGSLRLVLLAPDGTSRTTIYQGQRPVSSDWAPDDSSIVFADHMKDTKSWDLFTIHPDGTGLTRLMGSRTSESDPAFSPDGSLVVFDRTQRKPKEFSPLDLWTVALASGDRTRLTDTPNGTELQPDWQGV